MYEFVGPDDWVRSSLFDLATWKNGLAFKNIQFSDTGDPVIKIAELKSGITEQTKFTRGEYGDEVRVETGDMLFSWSGNPDTSIDVFEWDGPPGWLNQHIYKVTPAEGVDRDFLFFLLKWLKPRFAEIARNKQTTGLGHVTLADFRQMQIGLPKPDEQAAIVALVKPYHDKIELNRRMNATLEAMARAIFRDWFVDFGPTRAKMEGREPYLAPDLWPLFPDRLDDEGKPEGWEMSEIGKEATAVGGSTPSTKEPAYWGGNINWATPKDLSSLKAPVLLETSRTITEAGLEKISSGLLPEGTVLLSSRAPIGYVAIAAVPVAVNQGFIALKCEGRLSKEFVWQWLHAFMDEIKGNANGSTFQEISKKNFRPLPVVVPSEPARSAFDAIVSPMLERIIANERESRTLAQTRDLLLPRLMSGELRVAEAEKIVEEAL